jgi:hypothetical protein
VVTPLPHILLFNTKVSTTKMKALLFLSALAALSRAQKLDPLPVDDCPDLPNTTTISNFTFVHHPTNLSIKAFVQFDSLEFGVSCYGASPSSSGANIPIGFPGTATSIPCKGSRNGIFSVAKDGVNASVEFSTRQQCAATQLYFHYKADVLLSCSEDGAGVQTCVNGKGGNVIAKSTGWSS